MRNVFGVANRKGGQSKSTTAFTAARLCALYGARVLLVDLAQPGTTTASLRDIWPAGEQAPHADLSGALLAFQSLPPGYTPTAEQASAALTAYELPARMRSQPSWSGGYLGVLPWDDLLADAAAHLSSERVLTGLLDALNPDYDLAIIDFPGDGGPLLLNALIATRRIILPLIPETPALEGLEAMLRLLARTRELGGAIDLGGILLTRCEPKNKRVAEIAQTILRSDSVEGEPIGSKLFPFAIRQHEFFEQAFRYGEPIWERTANYSHWAGYVLLAEWLLRESNLEHLASQRRGPTLLPPDTRIFDLTATPLDDPEIRLLEYERAHAAARLNPTPS